MREPSGPSCAALLLGVVLCGACSSSTAPVRALMQAPIVPASDAIFGAVVYTNGQLAHAPASDADWDKLGSQAAQLEEAATRLETMAPAADPVRWREASQALGRASADVRQAARDRKTESVLDAGSRLYDACTTCHATYAVDPIQSSR